MGIEIPLLSNYPTQPRRGWLCVILASGGWLPPFVSLPHLGQQESHINHHVYFNAASMTALAMGAARAPPLPPLFSTSTATTTCGFSAGGMPMNQAWGGLPS